MKASRPMVTSPIPSGRPVPFRLVPLRLVLLLLASLLLALPGALRSAQITVDTPVDAVALDGFVSLREAVQAANTDAPAGDAPAGAPGVDVVTFSPDLDGATLTLAGSPLTITQPLVLEGLGPSNPTVSGGGTSQVLVLTADGITVRNLTLADGFGVDGGAVEVRSGAGLTLEDAALRSSVATRRGGGLFTGGAVILRRVTVEGNEARGSAADEGGGGVFNAAGLLTITGSVVRGNRAIEGSGSGGGIHNGRRGDLLLSDSEVVGNQARRAGGGIEIGESTSSQLRDVLLLGNSAGPLPGHGGGLHVTSAGTLEIDSCRIVENRATGEGGGLAASAAGEMTVERSLISGNQAEFGGGIHKDGIGGGLTLRTTLLVDNRATRAGGGLRFEGGRGDLGSTTLSGNEAEFGGGLSALTGGDLVLTNVTLASNRALVAGGGLAVSGPRVVVGNTILADNTAPLDPDLRGTVVSTGHNLIEDPGTATLEGDTAGNVLGKDPQLGPLEDNGGPTATHRPRAVPGNPVLDAGDGALVSAASLFADQRGFQRVVDLLDVPNATDGTDMGAVEIQGSIEGPLLVIPTLGRWALLAMALILMLTGAAMVRLRP